MAVRETLEADMRQAMRDRNELARDTLRMVISALQNKRIELGEDLTEEQELGVLSSAVKSRTDSAEQYDQAERPELAEKERAEIGIIEAYLPKKLSEEATSDLVRGLVSELGLSSKKEIGRLMKEMMSRHRGQVDGKLVQRLASELLVG